MPGDQPGQVTELLQLWRQGDEEALRNLRRIMFGYCCLVNVQELAVVNRGWRWLKGIAGATSHNTQYKKAPTFAVG